MNQKDQFTHFAVSSLIAFAATVVMSPKVMAAEDPQGEKCYAIAKAGANDCQTASESCAGSAKADKQGDAFLFLPKGVCEKIVGGSLTPVTTATTPKK